MYMLNALIEGLGSDVEGSESLIRDEIYQEEVESKLEKIIYDFKRLLGYLLFLHFFSSTKYL
jgi:hypothetical protein